MQGGGEQFGIERLVAELERAERQDDTVQVTVRRLSHALMRQRGGATSDDATLFLLEWRAEDADHLTKIDKPSTG